MDYNDMYEQISKMRDKTYEITDIVNTGNLSDLTDAVDSLNEEEAKTVLKMILLGEWKRLME